MFFPSSDVIKTAKPSTAFLLLSWHELFSHDTPDSFRPKLHNSESLINELGIVAIQKAPKSIIQSQLRPIIEELKTIAAVDHILSDSYPFALNIINEMDSQSSVESTLSAANILKYTLKDYGKKIVENFERQVDSLPKNKTAVIRCLSGLATHAVTKQISSEDYIETFNYEKDFERHPSEIRKAIVDAVNRTHTKWMIILGIKGGMDCEIQRLISRTGFNILPNKKYPLGKKGKNFIKQIEGFCPVYMEKESFGSEKALTETLPEIRKVLDIVNLYHASEKFTLFDCSLILHDREQKCIPIKLSEYSKLKPFKNATRRAVDLLRSLPVNKMPGALVRAIEQYAIAQQSLDIRVQLINTWTAIETLLGHCDNENVIGRISRLLPPMIVGGRLNKLVKYLAISLKYYGFCSKVPNETGWFKKSKYNIKRDELLLALSGAAGHDTLKKLFQAVSPHPLLCFRLFEIYKLLNDPKNLIRDLESSFNRTNWQIHRIYRARNAIVHYSGEVDHLPFLLTNLKFYFNLAITGVLNDLRRHRICSIEDSLEYRRFRLNYILDNLKKDPSKMTAEDLLQKQSDISNLTIWPR